MSQRWEHERRSAGQAARPGHAPYQAGNGRTVTHHGQHQQPAAVAGRAPAPAAAPLAQAPRTTAHLSSTTFASLPLAPASQRALQEVLGFSNLTEVQDATLPVVLAGGDVMARAKTGSGKTMAFLIPAIEALIRAPPKAGSGIPVLILSPTRELASQVGRHSWRGGG